MLSELSKNCHTMLELSTAHLPSSEPDFGHYRAIKHKFGYVVFVMLPQHTTDPDWLLPIMEFASKSDCVLINFDRDADMAKCLATYDW